MASSTCSSDCMRLNLDKYIAYVLLAVSVGALAASIATLNVYLIAVTAVLALTAILVHKMWGVIEAWVFEKTNLVQLFNGFELSGSRSSMVAKTAGGYTATSAARITTLGQSGIDRGKVEDLISGMGAPFKLIMHVEKVNTPRLLEHMETKKGMKEIELSRIERPGSGKGLVLANRLKSEIALLEHEIDGIKGGGMPLKLAYYIMTSAVSESRHKAEEEAVLQMRELSVEFDAAFGTKSVVLSGEEMVKLMRFDSAIV